MKVQIKKYVSSEGDYESIKVAIDGVDKVSISTSDLEQNSLTSLNMSEFLAVLIEEVYPPAKIQMIDVDSLED